MEFFNPCPPQSGHTVRAQLSYRLFGTLQNPNAANNTGEPIRGKKKYYMLTFDYTFRRENDEVYFAYALPYTFSKLHYSIKDIMEEHSERVRMLEQ